MPADDIAWAVAEVLERRAYYQLHRDYYEGAHRLAFATTRFRQTFGPLFEKLRDNLCPPVVDSLVDRVQITGWASAGNDATGQAATDLWDINRQGRAGQVHLEAVRCGDGFELVWPGRDGTARFWPQDPRCVAVEYDDDDDPERIARAGKLWKRPDKRHRLNTYTRPAAPSSAATTPGLIERWVTVAKTDDVLGLADPAKWKPWEEDTDGPEVAHEWGVPMFHFPNGAAVGNYGRSELRDVVPLQDVLNKTVADMLVAGEFVALPQRIFIGVEKEVDPLTGEERRIELGADRVVRIGNEKAQAVEWTQADLSKFVALSDSFRVEICRVSGTPLADMQLQGSVANLAAETLNRLDARQVKKCRDRIGEWTPVHQAAMALGLRMGNAEGIDPAKLEVQWAEPEQEPEEAKLKRAQMKLDLGYPLAQVLRELGKSDDEIQSILDERTAEQGQMADAMLASFDRGNTSVGAAGFGGGGADGGGA